MIYIFGSTGMLGYYVLNVLNKYYNTQTFNRSDFDILNDDWSKLYEIIKNVKKSDIIINCAGAIPQKIELNNYKAYIRINTLFPHKLQEISNTYKCKLIHITTDCVFDGKKGSSYNENDVHTETNIYGSSKSLGEPENATVIRTSIIGEEPYNKKGLLEWVKSNKNKTIKGFSNHLWNGITCLQLAFIIYNIIENNNFWTGVKHIYSPNIVSKYDLCEYINKCYDLNINIIKSIEKNNINKSLTSIYNNNNNIPNIKQQIIEQYLHRKQIHIFGKNSFIGKNIFDYYNKFNTYIYSHNDIEKFKNNISNNDVVINCCGVNSGTYDELYNGNVSFVETLNNIINMYNNISFIHLSSIQVSDSNNNSNFKKTKEMGENIIVNNNSSSNFYSILRLCNIYGYNHINPYKNSFINTLIYENNNNIVKKYNIIDNEMFILNIDSIYNLITNFTVNKKSSIFNVISQYVKISDILKKMYNKEYIEKYFTIKQGVKISYLNKNDVIIE